MCNLSEVTMLVVGVDLNLGRQCAPRGGYNLL
jgi:hypothetical protein